MEASSGLMLEFLRCCLSVSGSVKTAVQQEWQKKRCDLKVAYWISKNIWSNLTGNGTELFKMHRTPTTGVGFQCWVKEVSQQTHAPGKKYKKNRVIASPVPPLGVFIHPTSIYPIIFPSSLSHSFLTHCWHTGLMQGVSRLCFKCFFRVMELFRCFVFKTIPVLQSM